MDFNTSSNEGRGKRRAPGRRPFDFSTSSARTRRRSETYGPRFQDRRRGFHGEVRGFRIPAGSRKAALVHLALAAWHAGELDPGQLGEVRGREVDETGLQRALYRSSMGEIEHILGPAVKDRLVVVEGRLAGTARTAIERLGAEVEELRIVDEKRFMDMTPIVFIFGALAMAARYISLGLDDQDLYILAGLGFALMYGIRPFFYKLQRPRDE